MAAITPNAAGHDKLGPLASRYVDVAQLPWVASKYPGIKIKILMEDKDSGLITALFRCEPGAQLPLHEHTDIEQTYVLEGSLADRRRRGHGGQLRLASRGQPPLGTLSQRHARHLVLSESESLSGRGIVRNLNRPN